MSNNEFKIYAVTNRSLCEDHFIERVGRIAAAGVDAIILREKDLKAEEYLILAREVFAVCKRYETQLIVHSFVDEALLLGCGDVQLSLSDFIRISAQRDNAQSTPLPRTRILTSGCRVGVSIHSLAEAKEVVSRGADRLITGHIFKTGSKAGIAPKGTEYLTEICRSVDIPVVGIGGIDDKNIAEVKKTGAAGVAIMSSLMVCDDPTAYVLRLRGALGNL
jgi:thiamine-phosphate pyrophosphorylase